jgi:hypothetical protein
MITVVKMIGEKMTMNTTIDLLGQPHQGSCDRLASGHERVHELRFRPYATSKTLNPATPACTGRAGRSAKSARRRSRGSSP